MKYVIQWTDGKGFWDWQVKNLDQLTKTIGSIYRRKGQRRPRGELTIHKINK